MGLYLLENLLLYKNHINFKQYSCYSIFIQFYLTFFGKFKFFKRFMFIFLTTKCLKFLVYSILAFKIIFDPNTQSIYLKQS